MFHFAVIDRTPPDLDGKELAAAHQERARPSSARLVLTTAPGRTEKPSALVRAGFDAWIAKPVSERKLLTAILHVAEDLAVRPARPAPRRWRRSSRARRQAVLLVEDNLVNQKVTALTLRRHGLRGRDREQRAASPSRPPGSAASPRS